MAESSLPQQNIDLLFSQALVCHQSGQLNQAAAFYQQILQTDPNHAQSLYHLGLLSNQLGQPDVAVMYLYKAIQVNSTEPNYYNDLGLILYDQNKIDDAISCYNRAIQLKPNFAEAYNNLGNALKSQNRFNDAIEAYKKALKSNPNLYAAFYNVGNTYQALKRYDEAIACFEKALSISPGLSQAYNNLGTIYKERQQIDTAISCYRQAIQANPQLAEAHNNLGAVLELKGQQDEAMACYRKALTINPNFAEAYNNLANILRLVGEIDEAIQNYQSAIRFDPQSAAIPTNLGVTLLHEAGKPRDAINSFHHALTLDPNYVEAHCYCGLAYLLLEDFEHGWPAYEWRFQLPEFTQHHYEKPRWNGEPLTTETILVHAEQGFGDTLQFVRYLPLLKAKTQGKVIFLCQKSHQRLLTNIQGCDELIVDVTPSLNFDLHVPLLSLPGLFKTNLENIPTSPRYIQADPEMVEAWAGKLSNENRFKVGLVWAGNPKSQNDYNRSCTLDQLAPLATVDQCVFYSLQKWQAAEQAKTPPDGMALINLDSEIEDFADTAAIIMNLDLVITVDTSVAHLAGALGKPVWVMLPFIPDWRWFLNREKSPWYPSAHLFRQPNLRDWENVISEVTRALKTSVEQALNVTTR